MALCAYEKTLRAGPLGPTMSNFGTGTMAFGQCIHFHPPSFQEPGCKQWNPPPPSSPKWAPSRERSSSVLRSILLGNYTSDILLDVRLGKKRTHHSALPGALQRLRGPSSFLHLEIDSLGLEVVIPELRELPPSFLSVIRDDHLTDHCARSGVGNRSFHG